jgi:FkbM family methyltransferase
MPNLLNYFSKPEYFFRPRQALVRLSRIGKPVPDHAIIRLPWGATVAVHTHENVGREIYHYGIFDKTVPEAIWRLLDRGETALDIGANLGQNSTLMAARTGRSGSVLAFEPHPEIFLELKTSHELSQNPDFAPVRMERVALGQTNGEATLVESEEFSHNRGSAALRTGAVTGPGISVPLRRLDDFLGGSERVGVCKIDVEGHELDVLKGAAGAFQRRAIRDIVFEDFNPKPSPATDFLQQNGFTIFELHETWLKPRLTSLTAGNHTAPARKFYSNYLATLDVARATKRFRAAGWRCLLNL